MPSERVHHRRGAATGPVGDELGARPVEIAGVEERREALADFLVRGLGEVGEMCRAQEAMVRNQPDKLDVAVGQLEGRGLTAHEALAPRREDNFWDRKSSGHSESIYRE